MLHKIKLPGPMFNQVWRCLVLIVFAGVPTVILAADPEAEFPEVEFRGLLDTRLILANNRQSWLSGGLGKTRYSENTDRLLLGRVAEASLFLISRLSWSVTGLVQLKADRDQDQNVDLTQAYLRYRPVSTSRYRWRARAGVYFPDISMENTALGWTSPYSITPSAINTWVGEELKVLGIELTVEKTIGDSEIAFTGAATWFNDKAGTLLFRRGWALHDFKPGLEDRLPMAPPAGSAPGTIISGPGAQTEPFKEIDEHPGFYGALTWKFDIENELRLMYYDNRTDASTVEDSQPAWRNRLINIGVKIMLPGEIKLLSQFMTGDTFLILNPTTRPSFDFSAFYVLLSRDFGQHRLSARADWFEIEDTDTLPPDINENGWAGMLAYSVATATKQRLILEALFINSHRPARNVLAESADAKETILQASYRFFF